MNTTTIDLDRQRAEFEALFPIPANTIRCGDGYATTSFSAWEGQAYKAKWEGWQAALARRSNAGEAAVERLDEAVMTLLCDHTKLNQDGIDDYAMRITRLVNHVALRPVPADELGQQAEAAGIKTWQERMGPNWPQKPAWLCNDQMLAEIAELRAALATQQAARAQQEPVAWRWNRLDHNGKVVQHPRQNYPNKMVDMWSYTDDLKVAAELRGESDYTANPSYTNWQPLYAAPVAQQSEAQDEREFLDTLKGAASEASDEWIAGFVRQHFGIYGATQQSEAGATECSLPPDGWACTRKSGHQGPCAASPVCTTCRCSPCGCISDAKPTEAGAPTAVDELKTVRAIAFGEAARYVEDLTAEGEILTFNVIAEGIRALAEAPIPTEAGAPADLPWHDAVLAECMKIETGYQSADPVATIKAVIDWHVQEASGVADGIKVMADNYMRLTCGAAATEAGAPTAAASHSEIHTLRRLIECAEKLDARPRPMCRDCADENGTCPNSGLECDMRKLFTDAKALHNRLAAPTSGRESAAPGAQQDDEPDMLWMHDDPEVFAHSANEFASDYAREHMMDGETADVKVDCAYRGSRRILRIALGNGDDAKVSWSWIDAAMQKGASNG